MTVERKYERDIDLLLAEEFSANPPFAEQFKNLTKFSTIEAEVEDVWVSRSNNLGESDLIVLYRRADSSHFALLIEDKVDAPLQPDQGARYHLRAEKDVSEGAYDDYETLICAPAFYLEGRDDLRDFDHRIALEKIAEILRGLTPNPRLSYRINFLETAGSRRSNKWSREDDPVTNAFWAAAYQLASREFPQLEMKPLKVTKGSSWINFRPRDFPTTPQRIYVSFKGDRGHMDLTFSNTTAHLFSQAIEALLEPDMTVHQTKASTAIRLQTSGFRVADGAEAGFTHLRSSFEASARLVDFFRKNRAGLENAARIAGGS